MAITLKSKKNELRDALDDLPGGARAWTRGLAAGSLVTGAVLMATGKRRAGLAATVAGLVIGMMEDSDNLRDLWDELPNYIQSGHDALNRFETFVQDLSAQGEKIRSVMSEARG